MMNAEEIKKLSKGKTEEEMAKEQESLEEEVAVNALSIEQELMAFSEQTDELVNPETNTPICKVKRPSSEQFRRFTPPELIKYRKDPESIPYDVAEEYEKDMYNLMAELIVEPKHDAEWWKKLPNADEFMALFQAHMFKVRKQMQEKAKSFL